MIEPTFQGELQLAGWSETHNGGCKVTFWLPDSESLDPFRGLTIRKGNQAGHIFMAALVEIDNSGQPVDQPSEFTPTSTTESTQERSLAQRLHIDGYFNNPKLWDALERIGAYTQEEHDAFIKSQPCLAKWRGGMESVYCSGDVVGHHVRTAANSGTGIKPKDWWEIPLCHDHHDMVHRSATRVDRADHLGLAVSFMHEQSKMAMKRYLAIDSLSALTQELFDAWSEEIGKI